MSSVWRSVLQIDDGAVTFAEVHRRFRLLMTSRELDANAVFRLADAFEEARCELDEEPPLDGDRAVKKWLQRQPNAAP